MNEIYNVLRALVDPICIIFILLVISFFAVLRSSRKKNGALLLLLAIVLLYGFSIGPVPNYLSWKLEKDYIQNPASSKKPLDVVVVLGGGIYEIHALSETFPAPETSARLLAAIRVFKASNARYLVCSGKGDRNISEAALMARMAEDLGVAKEKIRLDEKSENTCQHAVEFDKMFSNKNIRIGLVTGAYHMKRSEIEFRKYFKNVTTLPSNYLYSSPSGTAALRYIPQSGRLFDNTLILKELVGRLWYSIKSGV